MGKKSKKKSTAADIAKWANLERVDAKGLSKQLPDIAKAIRKKILEPKEVIQMVRDSKEQQLFSELEPHLSQVLNSDNPSISRIGGLEIMTGAEPLLCDLVRVVCGIDENMSYAFIMELFGGSKTSPWKDVAQKIKKMGKDTAEDFETLKMVEDLQKAFDHLCEKRRSQIERLTRKSLEEHCWAYNQSLLRFLEVLAELIHRNENFSLEGFCRDAVYSSSIREGLDNKVEAAVHGVQRGHDTIKYQCWECGKSDIKVYKCACCEAARYCSKECQRKSWKDGHKEACKELKDMYQGFTNNISRIDEALRLQKKRSKNSSFDSYGRTLPPAGTKDYCLVPYLLTHYSFPLVLHMDDIISRGSHYMSIDHMYKSLDSIVKGNNHWMFRGIFPAPLEGYINSHTLECANQAELNYMRTGLLFLTVDISRMRTDIRSFVVNMFLRHLRKHYETNGDLMPVTRFIEIYYRFGIAELEGYEDAGSRLECMSTSISIMIKFFHKKKGQLDLQSLMNEYGYEATR